MKIADLGIHMRICPMILNGIGRELVSKQLLSTRFQVLGLHLLPLSKADLLTFLIFGFPFDASPFGESLDRFPQ